MYKIKFYVLILLACSISFTTGCNLNNQTKKEHEGVEQAKDISVKEAKAKLGQQDVLFLDVRTKAEIADGKISGAAELDFRSSDFKTELAKLDKSKSYIVYCKSGGRSAKALNIMKTMGFDKVQNMLGGYTAWQSKEN